MNKNSVTKLFGGLLATFLLVAAVGTVTAYAQESTPTSQPSQLNGGRHGGPGGPGGRQPLSSEAIDAVAQALGMTSEDVNAALQSGKTFEGLAQEAGVDVQVVRDAIKAFMPVADGGRGMRGMDDASLEAAANALGMTTDEVSAALQDGKTLEDLAQEAGVDVQVVRDALQAVRIAEMRTNIEQGLADGTISQEKAYWLLIGLEKGFLTDGLMGLGRGPGKDFRGHGMEATGTNP